MMLYLVRIVRRDRALRHQARRHIALIIPIILSFLTITSANSQGLPRSLSRSVRISIVPQVILLDGPASRRRLLVEQRGPDGATVDLTGKSVFTSSNRQTVRIGSDGFAIPVADGKATIYASVNKQTVLTTVTVKGLTKPGAPSFTNQVEPVLAKQGCNMGTCHGAGSGKGGFRLTLRGYDPDVDYSRICFEGRSRRVVRTHPEQSLILKKPSLEVTHLGGLRLRRDSLEYKVLADWIASGAPGPNPKDPKLVGLEVYPKERILAPGSEQRLQVTARFSDGHAEDVTHWAKFTSNEEPIAGVDDTGRIKMKRFGETAISVSYLGKVAFGRVAAPFPNKIPASSFKSLPRANPIDNLVYDQLERIRLLPSARCGDSEFLRRVYLDTTGTLPTTVEGRRFLNDSNPKKRELLIGELLFHPEYVDYWTYKWADLLRVNRDLIGEKGMWALYRWLRECVAENRPWDEIVRDLLTATGPTTNNGPANFYRLGSRPEEFAENISQAFLGIRIQCAKCHNHPFEKWTQSDYYRMSGFFARVGRKADKSGGGIVVFAAAKGDVDHPKLGRPIPPAAFDGPTLALAAPGDRRVFLADWMTSPANPYFARTVVNRVWKHYMGRGLVEPVDDMRLTNPATNGPLLDWLSHDFAIHGFDLRRLTKNILLSGSYQTSSRPNLTNKIDDRFYSRYLAKRLPAEVLLDAVCQVTGQPEKYPGIPAGARAVSLPDTQVRSAFLDVFGRPARQVTCECERNMEPNVAQALHLISAETINRKVSSKGGMVDRLIASEKSDKEILAEIYLATLCRAPTASEESAVTAALQSITSTKIPTELPSGSVPGQPIQKRTDPTTQKPNISITHQPSSPITQFPNNPTTGSARSQVFADMLWALLSGPEFAFNH